MKGFKRFLKKISTCKRIKITLLGDHGKATTKALNYYCHCKDWS